MKRFNRLGFAAALLAGSALSVTTVSAQEADTTKPRLQDQKAPSAKPEAPGQKKLDGQAATEMAPSKKQQSDEVDSAAEAAPGQVKREGQADAAGKAGETKPNENAATETAPGQQQKAGQADAQDAAPGQMQKNEQADSATEVAPGQEKQDRAGTDQQPSNETTGSIDISAEQKTEIRTIVQEAKVEPADIDIDLRVGVAVPTTVEFHPLPPRFVEIVPQYRGYEYFVLADGRIIIVEPSTHEVVYILVV